MFELLERYENCCFMFEGENKLRYGIIAVMRGFVPKPEAVYVFGCEGHGDYKLVSRIFRGDRHVIVGEARYEDGMVYIVPRLPSLAEYKGARFIRHGKNEWEDGTIVVMNIPSSSCKFQIYGVDNEEPFALRQFLTDSKETLIERDSEKGKNPLCKLDRVIVNGKEVDTVAILDEDGKVRLVKI